VESGDAALAGQRVAVHDEEDHGKAQRAVSSGRLDWLRLRNSPRQRQWNEGVIRIETTEFYRPKSHNSEGDVRVDPELLEIFQGYYARRKSDFVIESDSPPLPFDAPYGVYRCQDHMRALIGWLRSKGVNSKTPLHTLRKQFGSEIHARYGLLAASEQLRHGGIAVTARHYVENKQRSILGFGHLFKGERTIISINDEGAYSAP
jgi:hypothetical protein